MITDSANEVWIRTLEDLLYKHRVDHRIKGALKDEDIIAECLNHQAYMNMSYPQVTILSRVLNTHYAQAEAFMILTGSNDLKHIPIIERTLSKWSDDGHYIRHAYGPKFVDQMPYILQAFKNDLFTRRAVVNIWRESPGPSKDTTCLISLQFLVRDNKIYCIANMRSSDAYLGFVNDLSVFTYLAEAVRLKINDYLGKNVQPGCLYCNAGSRHIYANQLDKIDRVLQDISTCGDGAMPMCDNYDEFMGWLMQEYV